MRAARAKRVFDGERSMRISLSSRGRGADDGGVLRAFRPTLTS
jgi:hypothetical protein